MIGEQGYVCWWYWYITKNASCRDDKHRSTKAAAKTARLSLFSDNHAHRGSIIEEGIVGDLRRMFSPDQLTNMDNRAHLSETGFSPSDANLEDVQGEIDTTDVELGTRIAKSVDKTPASSKSVNAASAAMIDLLQAIKVVSPHATPANLTTPDSPDGQTNQAADPQPVHVLKYVCDSVTGAAIRVLSLGDCLLPHIPPNKDLDSSFGLCSFDEMCRAVIVGHLSLGIVVTHPKVLSYTQRIDDNDYLSDDEHLLAVGTRTLSSGQYKYQTRRGPSVDAGEGDIDDEDKNNDEFASDISMFSKRNVESPTVHSRGDKSKPKLKGDEDSVTAIYGDKKDEISRFYDILRSAEQNSQASSPLSRSNVVSPTPSLGSAVGIEVSIQASPVKTSPGQNIQDPPALFAGKSPAVEEPESKEAARRSATSRQAASKARPAPEFMTLTSLRESITSLSDLEDSGSRSGSRSASPQSRRSTSDDSRGSGKETQEHATGLEAETSELTVDVEALASTVAGGGGDFIPAENPSIAEGQGEASGSRKHKIANKSPRARAVTEASSRSSAALLSSRTTGPSQFQSALVHSSRRSITITNPAASSSVIPSSVSPAATAAGTTSRVSVAARLSMGNRASFMSMFGRSSMAASSAGASGRSLGNLSSEDGGSNPQLYTTAEEAGRISDISYDASYGRANSNIQFTNTMSMGFGIVPAALSYSGFVPDHVLAKRLEFHRKYDKLDLAPSCFQIPVNNWKFVGGGNSIVSTAQLKQMEYSLMASSAGIEQVNSPSGGHAVTFSSSVDDQKRSREREMPSNQEVFDFRNRDTLGNPMSRPIEVDLEDDDLDYDVVYNSSRTRQVDTSSTDHRKREPTADQTGSINVASLAQQPPQAQSPTQQVQQPASLPSANKTKYYSWKPGDGLKVIWGLVKEFFLYMYFNQFFFWRYLKHILFGRNVTPHGPPVLRNILGIIILFLSCVDLGLFVFVCVEFACLWDITCQSQLAVILPIVIFPGALIFSPVSGIVCILLGPSGNLARIHAVWSRLALISTIVVICIFVTRAPHNATVAYIVGALAGSRIYQSLFIDLYISHVEQIRYTRGWDGLVTSLYADNDKKVDIRGD
jgi:hypothetical protein